MAHPDASNGVQLDRLAEEQAALRRVATLVAEGAEAKSLFAVVAEQVARVLRVPLVSIVRFESDGRATERASFSDRGAVFPVGKRWSLDGTNVLRRLRASGHPARIDDYTGLEGEIAENCRRVGICSTVGIPIAVAGRMWGAMVVSATAAQLPADTEARLTDFTELVATAIANSEAQAEVARLAEEQAALRRVATLVARGTGPEPVFRAVADEVQALVGADASVVVRFEDDATVTVMGAHGGSHPPGTRVGLEPSYVVEAVRETGQAARFDTQDPSDPSMPGLVRAHGVRSALACPIVVEGRLWGAITVGSLDRRLPADTERRLADFTELAATAVANTHAREQAQRLADEQAALRRVATLVARESPEAEVLTAVAEEVSRLFGGQATQINRFEGDGTATCVASVGVGMPVGTRMSLDDDSTTTRVYRTGRPARIERYREVEGSFAGVARRAGVQSVVAVPIVVDGRLWGIVGCGLKDPRGWAADTELRMAEFAELVATAISKLQARSDLAASRARVVAAADAERRRVVRDLHDGAQQRLVHTVVTLTLAKQALDRGADDAPLLLKEALDQARQATGELRELAHGILPSVLTHGGLRAGVDALASRMPVPVRMEVSVDRLPPDVEATAYFVVAEALTNVAKHASAGHAEVVARIQGGTLSVEVRDDGSGGARADGSGLVGLADRLAALDGRLEVDSPVGGGTRIAAAVPLR